MQFYKAGQLLPQLNLGYKAFIPSPINRSWQVDDSALLHKLGKADRFIGRLDAFSEMINIDLYVRMHVTKEAMLSAKIEGTQTSFQEALMDRDAIAVERRDDWEEVNNYVAAINYAVEELDRLPLSLRLIRQTHAILMQGVRGATKSPGTFRRSQNWIGGSNPGNAIFVPPPHQEVDDLMSDLEKLLNDPENPLPELLKIALVHYQFETIHPFLDGNGRLGRLLIPLFLVDREILNRPILYLSAFFERNRKQYYDRLTAVRTENDLLGWFHFFLDGLIETTKDGVNTFQQIIALERELPERLKTLGKRRAASARQLLRYMMQHPIIGSGEVSTIIESSPVTGYALVKDLLELGVLEEVAFRGRGKRVGYRAYLDLFR